VQRSRVPDIAREFGGDPLAKDLEAAVLHWREERRGRSADARATVEPGEKLLGPHYAILHAMADRSRASASRPMSKPAKKAVSGGPCCLSNSSSASSSPYPSSPHLGSTARGIQMLLVFFGTVCATVRSGTACATLIGVRRAQLPHSLWIAGPALTDSRGGFNRAGSKVWPAAS
jgi:hypothetical protein